MFDFSKDTAIKPKIHVAHGLLPSQVDAKQLPSSKPPFGTILDQCWSHKVEVLLPKAVYDSAWKTIEQAMGQYQYSRVIMSLAQLLEGDFFNMYIKTGNVSMLSEGRAGLDCLYSLHEGVLRLDLSKDKYERAGLVGKPVPDGGRKHIRTRFAVEVNLRQPSMVGGKKGFERILWASKNVLNESLAWLFIDHDAKQTLATGSIPVSLHHSTTKTVIPTVVEQPKTRVPPLDAPTSSGHIEDEQEASSELLEWIGLSAIDSERHHEDDRIDPYLSRYQVPMGDQGATDHLVSLRWRGFLESDWVRRLFMELLMATRKDGKAWFAFTAHAFRGQAVNADDGYTILRLPAASTAQGETKAEERPRQSEYLLWQMTNTLTHR